MQAARGPSLRLARSSSVTACPRCCSSSWAGVRVVGEDGVVAPGGEQLALPGPGVLILVADAADDEPGSDMQGFVLRGECRVAGLGDPHLWPPDGAGTLGLEPCASHPAVTSDAHQSGDRS